MRVDLVLGSHLPEKVPVSWCQSCTLINAFFVASKLQQEGAEEQHQQQPAYLPAPTTTRHDDLATTTATSAPTHDGLLGMRRR